MAVVVESHEMRPLKIRPTKSKSLSDGDEEIELFIGEGDAYAMDGHMQKGYEHCLTKKKNVNSHRNIVTAKRMAHHSVQPADPIPHLETE